MNIKITRFISRIFNFNLLFFCSSIFCTNVLAQTKNLDFFLLQGITNDATLRETKLSAEILSVQNQIINAQNKTPLVYLTADYLFSPYFNSNGKPVEVTDNPSSNATGYDIGLSNGGLYSALINVSLPLFNTAMISSLYAQNKVLMDLNTQTKLQQEHDLVKNITDKYILAFQIQEQEKFMQDVITKLIERKNIMATLVENGLLAQTDYKLLEIEINNNRIQLNQLEINYINAFNDLKNASIVSDTATFKLEKPLFNFIQHQGEYHYLNKYRLDSLNLVAQKNIFDAKYKPQINLVSNAGLNSTYAMNIPHNFGLAIGLNLNIPIYDGHQKQLNEKQTKIQIDILKAYKENTRLLLKNNLKNTSVQVDKWKVNIKLLDEQIKQREILINMLKEKQSIGQVSMLEYITAIQDYVDTQNLRLMAEINLMLFVNQFNYLNW